MTNENKVLRIDEIGTAIDKIVTECLPITTQKMQGFSNALTLAKGIKSIKEYFIQNAEIKENITAMQDTALGFMTDKSPAAVEAAKKKNNTIVPYTYEQVVDCCIEGMLQGYRITGNEFNIIAGRFYGAKNGKYRKIVDNPKIMNFFFTNTSPLFDQEERVDYGQKKMVPIAKVQCFATWLQDGTPVKLGYEDDKLIFKIKVNAFMGDDGVTGKALSKLFTRVLMRIEGNIISEEVDVDEEPAGFIPEKPLSDRLKDISKETPSSDVKKQELSKPAGENPQDNQKDEPETSDSLVIFHKRVTQKNLAAFERQQLFDYCEDQAKTLGFKIAEYKTKFGKNFDESWEIFQAKIAKDESGKGPGADIDPGGAEPGPEKSWQYDDWHNMRKGNGKTTGFAAYVEKYKDSYHDLVEGIKKGIRQKWINVYPEVPFPIEVMIIGIDQAEGFKHYCSADFVELTCKDIFAHPSKYSEFKDGTTEALHRFISQLYVFFIDGSEKTLVDIVNNIGKSEDTKEPEFDPDKEMDCPNIAGGVSQSYCYEECQHKEGCPQFD